MTSGAPAKPPKRSTPDTASEFEREQLKFFLSQGDLASTLAKFNPSLAWLPMLSELKLIQREQQLMPWIERNLTDPQAVRDVVASLRFFGPETANFLEYRINRDADRLTPLMLQCWRLIVRHMRTPQRGPLHNEWFDLAPRVKKGDLSVEVIQRLSEALQPKLTLSKRISFQSTDDRPPEKPWDLMSISYEVADDLTGEEVLEAWPESANEDADARLLSSLTASLEAALQDATDVGVEGGQGYGRSDSDVPSIAVHGQNAYHNGFQAIVRVMAGLWERLVKKSPARALQFVVTWRDSPHRLMRRLALFAAADSAVSGTFAADVLLALPPAELFLTASPVEVFRLIRTRWKEFPAQKQDEVLRRMREGPPRDWYREDAEIEKYVDRARFDALAEMQRDGVPIGADGEAVLMDIRTRWSKWELRPPEQAGFHVWTGSSWGDGGDAAKFEDVEDGELVTEAVESSKEADSLSRGDDWHALSLSDPDRAVRGLDAAAAKEHWPTDFWRQLLWTRKAYAAPGTEQRIAELLLLWPATTFGEIAAPASSWLTDHAGTLDEPVLWQLWDRITDSLISQPAEAEANDE